MNVVHFGDCRDTMRAMIAQGVKVQMCVTSPPYFGLRDYGTGTWAGGDPECSHSVGGQVQDNKAPGAISSGVRPGCDSSKCRKCGALRVDKQIGLEQTPAEYVANMVEVFSLVWYLLADDGVLWLNLGDSYCGYKGDKYGDTKGNLTARTPTSNGTRVDIGTPQTSGLKPKDLIGIPWRVAFALQEAGWYLRQDIIWHKPNPMPESVTDRCTKAHEYLFLLSKRERYYFDSAAIAEPANLTGKGNANVFRGGSYVNSAAFDNGGLGGKRSAAGNIAAEIDATRNKRSVWTVATTPYSGAHFATFPPALIEPCILAGSRPGDVVLDPFFGSGTTGQVAQKLGRWWIGCELNPDYGELQKDRTAQDAFVFA